MSFLPHPIICISGFKGSPISVSLEPYHLYLSSPQASTSTSSSSSLHLLESLTPGPPSHSTTNQGVWTISTHLWMPLSQKLFLHLLISKDLLHFCYSPSMAIPGQRPPVLLLTFHGHPWDLSIAIPGIFPSPSTLPLESGIQEPHSPIQPPSLSNSFHANSFISSPDNFIVLTETPSLIKC